MSVLIAPLLALAILACGSGSTSVASGAAEKTWSWQPMVDSHVHLAYSPVAAELARRGVTAAVDLAAPEQTLGKPQPLTVIASGPMLTSPGGYPLDSWGAGGYGIGCANKTCVMQAIDRLAAAGAKVIKIAADPGGLDPSLLAPAIEHAHAKQLRVAVHALTADAARRTAAAGADLLAHTPVEPLDTETVAAWRGRAVISTLAAFGGRPETLANLRALHGGGVTVLYGTDLGNVDVTGPSSFEISLLRMAGLSDELILYAMTSVPLDYWGLPDNIDAADATKLVLDADPRIDVSTLLRPRAVYIRGQVQEQR